MCDDATRWRGVVILAAKHQKRVGGRSGEPALLAHYWMCFRLRVQIAEGRLIEMVMKFSDPPMV